MLAPGGRAWLSDFGIAKLADSATVTTLNLGTPGTLAYMSPEQMSSRPVDYRTDVYSFGPGDVCEQRPFCYHLLQR